jgi:hypothetical protein
MKVLQIVRLRTSSHAQMRENVELFEQHGATGLEAFWLSADARTIVALYEMDNPTDMQKSLTLYAPHIEQIETHVVTDGPAGVANVKAGLGLAP